MSAGLQDLGRELVLFTLGAIRTLQTHGWDNQAAHSALDRLLRLINGGLAELGGPIQLDIVDDMLLINGTRLRAHGTQGQQLAQLTELFTERGVGGVAFLQPISLEALRYWTGVFAQRLETDQERQHVRGQLEQLEAHGIHTLSPRTLSTPRQHETLQVSTLAFAMQTWARLVLGFREFVEALRTERDPYANRLNVSRVVQDLIDITAARADLMLYILQLQRVRKVDRPYADLHAANGCVLAVLIGQMLSLDRTTLLDLGTSALLADVASALLLEGELERGGQLDEADRLRLRAQLTRSVQALLGAWGNDDAAMLRTIVAFEQRRPAVDPDEPGAPGPHLLSRIVAVATAFDAMLSDRPWRPAMRNEEAIATLQKEAGTRYDPVIVSTLVSLTGLRTTS